jgi:hypothetical protein
MRKLMTAAFGLSALFATSGKVHADVSAAHQLVDLAQHAQSEGVRLNATLKILDWGHGKPSQHC